MKQLFARAMGMVVAAVCATVVSAAENGEPSAQWSAGKAVYERWCIACHGAGEGFAGMLLPGTEALMLKYGSRLPAVLHERQDLTPELVALFVRNGVSIMPFFRKTEISDAELAALGRYLSNPGPARELSDAAH